jgi:hypothetical protein
MVPFPRTERVKIKGVEQTLYKIETICEVLGVKDSKQMRDRVPLKHRVEGGYVTRDGLWHIILTSKKPIAQEIIKVYYKPPVVQIPPPEYKNSYEEDPNVLEVKLVTGFTKYVYHILKKIKHIIETKQEKKLNLQVSTLMSTVLHFRDKEFNDKALAGVIKEYTTAGIYKKLSRADRYWYSQEKKVKKVGWVDKLITLEVLKLSTTEEPDAVIGRVLRNKFKMLDKMSDYDPFVVKDYVVLEVNSKKFIEWIDSILLEKPIKPTDRFRASSIKPTLLQLHKEVLDNVFKRQ